MWPSTPGDVILVSGESPGCPARFASAGPPCGPSGRTSSGLSSTIWLLIPIAAGVLSPFEVLPGFLRHLHPILAALAMALSSITVVSNSLRLHRAGID